MTKTLALFAIAIASLAVSAPDVIAQSQGRTAAAKHSRAQDQRTISDSCRQGAVSMPIPPAENESAEPSAHEVIVGVYRPYLDHCRDSVLLEPVNCEGPNAGSNCVEKHGTYRRDVYLFADPRFDNNDGSIEGIRLVSDGLLDVMLIPSDTNPRLFTYQLNGVSGEVEIGGDCPAPRCFTLRGLTPALEKKYRIRNDRYQQTFRLPEQRHDQHWSSTFDLRPDNYRKGKRCYDIRNIDPNRLETSGFLESGRECSAWFVEPEGDGKRYLFFSKGGHNVAVPFGWTYVDRVRSWGGKRTSLLESEREINDHQLNSTGWNTGLNLVIFDNSLHHNKTVESRTKALYENNTTHSEWETVRPQFALVLDRQNLRLTIDFKLAVAKTLERYSKTRSNPDPMVRNKPLDDFLNDWGTHVPYATTFGAKGAQTLTLNGSEVETLAEQGVSLSTGASAGFSMPLEEFGLPGSAGMNVSLESADVKDHARRMKRELGDEVAEYHCIGGTSCNQGVPSPDKDEPLFLDLMPISDLLGPPMLVFSYPSQPHKDERQLFSSYSTDDFLELRAALREYIAEVAFVTDRSPRSVIAREYLRVKDFEIVQGRCEIATDTYFRNWVPLQKGCNLISPTVTLQNTSGRTIPIQEKVTVAVGALKDTQRRIVNGRTPDLIMVSMRGKLVAPGGVAQCAEIARRPIADASGTYNIKYQRSLSDSVDFELPLQAQYYNSNGTRTCAVRMFVKAKYDLGGAAKMLDSD